MSVSDDLTALVQAGDDPWDPTPGGGTLTQFVQALGGMFAEVEFYANDDVDADTVGWQAAWDPTLAVPAAYPWLAMLMGETLASGISDATALQLITTAPNQRRGSPQAIANAVKSVLTGSQDVGFRERCTSAGTEDDDALWVITLASQTPNQALVQQQLMLTVPADIDWYYTCLTNNTWATIESGPGAGSTWAEIQVPAGVTWGQLESNINFIWY